MWRKAMVEVQYPNESAEYRSARAKLLDAEIALRRQVEDVARQRRQLPDGGELKEDYVFDELVDGSVRQVSFSELLPASKKSLFVYSFMYAPDMDAACPMCTSFLDGLNGQMVHLDQRIGVVVVARNPIEKIREHAESRGWDGLRLLSSANNTYNTDYFGEVDGHQQTMINVFSRDESTQHGFRHFWGAEMAFAQMDEGQNMRHVDMMWPLWNVLDTTAEGRGDWYPALSYSQPVTLNGL